MKSPNVILATTTAICLGVGGLGISRAIEDNNMAIRAQTAADIYREQGRDNLSMHLEAQANHHESDRTNDIVVLSLMLGCTALGSAATIIDMDTPSRTSTRRRTV